MHLKKKYVIKHKQKQNDFLLNGVYITQSIKFPHTYTKYTKYTKTHTERLK